MIRLRLVITFVFSFSVLAPLKSQFGDTLHVSVLGGMDYSGVLLPVCHSIKHGRTEKIYSNETLRLDICLLKNDTVFAFKSPDIKSILDKNGNDVTNEIYKAVNTRKIREVIGIYSWQREKAHFPNLRKKLITKDSEAYNKKEIERIFVPVNEIYRKTTFRLIRHEEPGDTIPTYLKGKWNNTLYLEYPDYKNGFYSIDFPRIKKVLSPEDKDITIAITKNIPDFYIRGYENHGVSYDKAEIADQIRQQNYTPVQTLSRFAFMRNTSFLTALPVWLIIGLLIFLFIIPKTRLLGIYLLLSIISAYFAYNSFFNPDTGTTNWIVQGERENRPSQIFVGIFSAIAFLPLMIRTMVEVLHIVKPAKNQKGGRRK